MTDHKKMTHEDHERVVWKALKEATGNKVGDYEKPLTSYREEGEEMAKELKLSQAKERAVTEIKKDGYMSESKAVALRLVENNWDREFSYKFACPVCWSPEDKHGSSEYVHINEPEYRAWETTSASEPLYTRGDQVRIPMTTECEHSFVLVIGHHKGETFIGALTQ